MQSPYELVTNTYFHVFLNVRTTLKISPGFGARYTSKNQARSGVVVELTISARPPMY